MNFATYLHIHLVLCSYTLNISPVTADHEQLSVDYTYLNHLVAQFSALKLVVVEPQRGSKFFEDMFTMFTTSLVFLASSGINMEIILECVVLNFFRLDVIVHLCGSCFLDALLVTTRLAQATPSFPEVAGWTHNFSDIFGVPQRVLTSSTHWKDRGFEGCVSECTSSRWLQFLQTHFRVRDQPQEWHNQSR